MIKSKSLLVNRSLLYYSIRVFQISHISDIVIKVVVLVVNRRDNSLFYVDDFYSTIEKRVV